MNLFTVQLAVRLWLTAMQIPAWLSLFLAPVLNYFLQSMVKEGIIKLDLSIFALKEGMKLAEFKDAAGKEFRKAMSKVHTEGEKRAIREEYRKTLRSIGRFGNGVKP